jgi:hypothetical protein
MEFVLMLQLNAGGEGYLAHGRRARLLWVFLPCFLYAVAAVCAVGWDRMGWTAAGTLGF